MSGDFCEKCLMGELLGPPPVPPEELLSRADCRQILSGCESLSNHKGAWSNYSGKSYCLYIAKLYQYVVILSA